jgi:hypothetical protein
LYTRPPLVSWAVHPVIGSALLISSRLTVISGDDWPACTERGTVW